MVRSDQPISGVNFPPQGGDVVPRSSDLRVVFRPQLLVHVGEERYMLGMEIIKNQTDTGDVGQKYTRLHFMKFEDLLRQSQTSCTTNDCDLAVAFLGYSVAIMSSLW